MAEGFNNKTGGPGTVTEVEVVQNSKFLPRGKYFLLMLLLLSQGMVAYVVMDEYYMHIYVSIFGSPPDYSTTYKLEEIIANPAGTNAQRFLLVEIGLELTHRDHVELINRNLMRINDRFIEIISGRTVAQLNHLEERERLRVELADEVNEIIGTRSVRNLYFIKYVMQ